MLPLRFVLAQLVIIPGSRSHIPPNVRLEEGLQAKQGQAVMQ